MEYIETVNPRLNRSEYWRVIVEDLLVVFRRPFTEFQDKTYNETLPGTDHTLVREFDRKKRLVRFWSCQMFEYRGGVHLSFDWYDRDHSSSTGISFDRKDIVRMVRRGVHVELLPNPQCRSCKRRGDWRCGFRLDREYDPTRHFQENGIWYRTAEWFCNRCLAREQARGRERIDVFRPPDRTRLLARFRPSRRVATAERVERLTMRRWRRVMLRMLEGQRAFWIRETRQARRSRATLQALCNGRPMPATVQRVVRLLGSWQAKASRERERVEEEQARWKRVDYHCISLMIDR